jgi:hypothetical protein
MGHKYSKIKQTVQKRKTLFINKQTQNAQKSQNTQNYYPLFTFAQ